MLSAASPPSLSGHYRREGVSFASPNVVVQTPLQVLLLLCCAGLHSPSF